MHSMLNNLNRSEPLLAPVPGAEPSMINKVGVGKCLEYKCLYSCSISSIHGDKSGSGSHSKALGCVCPGAVRRPGEQPARRESCECPEASQELLPRFAAAEGDRGETWARRGGSRRPKQLRRRTESLSKQRGWDGGRWAGHGTGSGGEPGGQGWPPGCGQVPGPARALVSFGGIQGGPRRGLLPPPRLRTGLPSPSHGSDRQPSRGKSLLNQRG